MSCRKFAQYFVSYYAMANITYSSGAPSRGHDFRVVARRAFYAILTLTHDLKWELAEQRRHYRFERALRDLDLNQLQDIGFDRSGS